MAGSRRGRLPLGLLGMVAIVAAVESFVAADWADLTEPSVLAWPLGVAAAEGDAVGASVLCFGDSLVKAGMIPEVLEARLGGTTWNLALPASTAPAHYFMLRRVLRTGAKPRAIVVDFMPTLLLGTPDFGLPYWASILGVEDFVDLARAWKRPAFVADLAVRCLVPSYRSRWEIRDRLRIAIDPSAKRDTTTNPMLRRNWALHRGGQFTQDNPAWTGEPNEEEWKHHESVRFWCHPVNRDAIDRFLALAESRGIFVYWVLPPVTPKIQARRNASGADTKYTAFVREVASKHRGVVVLDARASGYDHTKFVDAIHLTGKGAWSLSSDVADAIADARDPWVALPTYRARPIPPSFENLEESRAVAAGRYTTLR